MKKPTFSRLAFVALLLFMGMEAYAQNFVPFTTEFNQTLKGDIRLIGNNILGPYKKNAYNGNAYNHEVNMIYVDVDGDNSTFNSSSADLQIPNEGCYKIVHAGLYWGAVNRGKESITDIKFKGPVGPYNNIKGTVIYDAKTVKTGNSLPYASYADVTSIVASLGTNLGTYTVANVSTGQGKTVDVGNGTGHSAGWSLFVVFEDPTLPGKYITSFDGFSSINKEVAALDIPISGFQTPPAPIPVTAKFAFAALEGDKPIKGDKLRINGTLMSTPERPWDNFFNSTVTKLGGGLVTNRNPNSTNTLGFDTGIMDVPNPNKTVIGNGDTSATIRMESTQDQYFAYFIAFAVDVIQPKIVLSKLVTNSDNVDIGGQVVQLGQQLNYVLEFQNVGNDDAREMIIRDVLPINVNFNYPADLSVPTSVTSHTYNPLTRELVFTIDKDKIKRAPSPSSVIKIRVHVVESCNELNDMCSNKIENQAFATYKGVENPDFISTDDPSVSSNTGCLLIPQATNFLANVDKCEYIHVEILCGDTVKLTAGSGYTSYKWTTGPDATGTQLGTGQSITVSATGTYYVHNTAAAPCLSIDEIFEVTNFVGATLINPITLPTADIISECKDDGGLLPKIFLCGGDDERLIDTKITTAESIIWEKLRENSCAKSGDNCANQSGTCVWDKVHEGPTFIANQAGQFRLTINYDGGCFNQFYFNVYKNALTPTVKTQDIICATPGKISISDVPAGYEFSIDGVNYDDTKVFEVSEARAYTVYIKQVGLDVNSSPCIFKETVQIAKIDLEVETKIKQPKCYGDLGNIYVEAKYGLKQYKFTLNKRNGQLVSTPGLQDDNFYTFEDLNPGEYTVLVSTKDGCTFTEDIEIKAPLELKASSALTIPITCEDGEITLTAQGGTAPYYYFVNGETTLFDEFVDNQAKYVVTEPGVYKFRVVDSNDCETTTEIKVDALAAPVFTVSHKDILCYNSNTGEIKFDVTNANGYTITYSIDDGNNYETNATISNLMAGTYITRIKYAVQHATGVTECISEPISVKIEQADTALTASAGVSELAGCGPTGDEGKGKVRITNPQGGTLPYEYSFNNHDWSQINEFYVSPGTYTLYVRDATGCTYAMPGIILDPEPVAPTINVSDPDFNCDGTADATVTVINPEADSFSYTYLLNGVENTNTADPKTFLNVPDGEHTISVRYNLETVPTYSNLLYETFGYGEDTTSPGINTTYYCFERQVEATKCNGNIAINDGDYSVTAYVVGAFSTWLQPGDHTPQTVPPTPKGRSLVVNIGDQIPVTAILYEKEIKDIIPNQPIIVDFYAINLLKKGRKGFDPNLLVALVDASGNEISSFYTNDIPKSEKWENFVTSLDPGNNTNLKFILRSNVRQVDGNDVAIDDIRVYQLPKSCVTEVDFPFIVATEKAFTAKVSKSSDASCFGSEDGSITIEAQNFDPNKGFQYSVNDGIWITETSSSSVTISGLGANDYDIKVRYDDAADTCTIPLKQTIEAPVLLEVTAIGKPATCLTGGTITVSATGGSAPYIYELLDTATLTLINTFPSNGILTNIPEGDYTVRATAPIGCSATTTLVLLAPPALKAEMKAADYCDNSNGVTLEVTASEGKTPYQYSMNGAPFSSKYLFTGLTPGDYTVIVRDANGCEVPLEKVTIEPKLTLTTKITKDLDCTITPGAIIAGTSSGGYAPYTYEVSIDGAPYIDLVGATGTSFSYPTPNARSYQFKITDAKGCSAISEVSTIAAIEKPTATTTVVDAKCYGASNGSFQIIPSGGVGPYTYSFNNSAFTPTSNYTGLRGGTYTYQVKDAKECIFNGEVTITEPTALVASANATSFSCSVDNTAQVAVVTIALPTTGTAPYKYSFNGSEYTSTHTLSVNDNGSTQTITYSVRDANGCTDVKSLKIAPLNAPTDLTFAATTITCNATTSTVTLTATKGVGQLQYETIAPSPVIRGKQNSNEFVGLSAGTYVFRVTDANGCFYTESMTIAPVTNIAVTGRKLSDALCYGDNKGSIQFTVSGYAGGYTADFTSVTGTGKLSQNANKIDLTELVAGDYTVEVTDTATGCKATETITIDQPDDALALSATASNVHCKNYDSQITATATGGTINYTYAAVKSGSPRPTASAYKSGNIITVNTNSGGLDWDVYVKDANGCIAEKSVTIVADALPTVTSPTVSNQCTAGSGFTFTAVGTGVAPLRYSINGGASYKDSGTFTVNAPGSYTITVIDGNGCIATSTTPTKVFAPITVSASLTQDLSCFVGNTNAEIAITANGGNAPYTYEVSDDGGTTYTTIPGPTYTTTIAGTYQFLIADANGCDKVTAPVTVNPIVMPEITSVAIAQNINCNDEETGALTITVDPTLGLAPFVLNVKNTTTGKDYGTQTSGLAAGDYVITVTDAKGCVDTETITLSEPEPIDIQQHAEPITCDELNGISKGSVIIDSVTGGTGPYNYFVTGTNGYAEEELNNAGTTSVTFNVVDFGLYQINVVDVNGCSVLVSDVLVASPPDDLDIVIDATADCINGGQAVVSIGTTLASAGPFYFSKYEGPGSIYPNPAGSWQPEDATGSKKTTFTGLTPGVLYTFIVYDQSTGCSYYEAAPKAIPTTSTLTADVLAANNITCKGSADGNVAFNIKSIYASDIDVSFEIFNSLSQITTGISDVGVVPANSTLPITNLGPLDYGNYYVLIKEMSGPNTGCSVVTLPFNITESSIDLKIKAQVSKNQNCNALGVISATGSFGTGPYTYQVVISGGTPDPSGWDTPNTFNLSAATYDVYVRDAYGCEKFDTVILIKDDEPTLDVMPQVCFDGTPFDITLVGTTFNLTDATYSIGGAFEGNSTFTITAAGTYILTIKDSNGCTATQTLIVAPPLLLDAKLELDLTCDLDARIELTPSGGTGTYDLYEVSFNNGAYATIALPYEPSVEGSYIFRVTDDQGCEAISNEIIVTPNTTPTFVTSTPINVSCLGGSDGSFIVTAADGIAPYRYSIDGVNFQTSNLFDGLAAGTYTVTVRDSKNCDSATADVIITEPDIVAGTGDLTFGLTCGVGNATQAATVTITGFGGTPPYTYSFDGINYTSVNVYKTFAAGTVTAYVKDANNCAVSDAIEVIVPALSVPTDLDFSATDVTCINTESDVTLTTTNGIGTLIYEIIAPASAVGNVTGATSGVFTGLGPDDYTFTVTDANGCYYTETYTVIPVTNLTVSGSLIADVSCFGGNDGAVTFEVAKFANTFSYRINGGAIVSGQTITTINITGLPLGDQTIEVTDETTGCAASYTVTVKEPTAVVLNEILNVNAYCDFGAAVTVQASGGTAPYQYAFVPSGSAPVAADYSDNTIGILDPATGTNWDVWTMDSNGCSTSIPVVIAEDPLPTIDVPTFASNQCTVANGFEFTVTNPTGVGPFEYSIGNGFQPSPTFTVANSGTYTVTIKDAHGCTNAVPVSIEIYPALALTPIATSLTSCDDNDGVITVTAVGGSGSYTYSINSNDPTIIETDNVFSGVPSGSYIITIEDTVTGCTETAPIILDAATVVDFTLTPTDASCNGGDDGTITVDLVAGKDDNPIYTYKIIGPITKPAQNSNVFIGLEAGTYTVQVNSGRGCVTVKDITVGQPDAIAVAAPVIVQYACNAGSNATTFASISVNALTGGSGTYTRYEFFRGGILVQSGSKNVYTETDLAGGTYDINVYDNKGCLGTSSAVIIPFISLDKLGVVIDTSITCNNDESIKVSVTSTGGTPTNLEFKLEDYAGIIATKVNATGIFTGLPIGNYKITVTNLVTFCSLETVHYISNPNTFDLTVDVVRDVICFDGTEGSVNVTFIDRLPIPTDNAGPFSYTVVDALGNPVANGTAQNAGPITISGLASGTYTITASLTNTPFCTVAKNFTITGPNAALAVFETHTRVTCDGGDGSIFATATGGWPGAYEFELSGTTITTIPYSTNAFFKNLSAGVYTVSVRDSRGCEVSEIIELTNPLPINVTASADVTMLNCYGDKNATITVDFPTGGQGSNYKYTLNTIAPVVSSSGPQLSNVFSGLGAGTYTITVTDGFNCTATFVNIVIQPALEIEASLAVKTTATCLTDASLELSAIGGTGPYTYSDDNFTTTLGNFVTSVTIPNVPVGTYKYYVKDANGCIATVSNNITIAPVPVLVLNLDNSNPTINCAGDDTGVIVAKAEGGLGNYVYKLQDALGNTIPAVQASLGVFTGLEAGTYFVRVDSEDCNETSNAIIMTEPATAVASSFIVSPITCYGSNNGSVEITASGGTGTIQYAISPQLNQFFDTNVFEDLAPGSYQVIVQDSQGCYVKHEFTIADPDPVMVSVDDLTKIPERCEGDNDGEFVAIITGGTAPYSVSVDDYSGVYFTGTATQTVFSFTGLAGGDHIVYVMDAEGCESEVEISFPESVKIDPRIEVEYDCENNTSGNIVTVTVDSSITDLSKLKYSLNGGAFQSDNIFTDVVVGIGHYIDVEHENGCVKRTDLFDIKQVDPLTLSIADGGLNEIVATATGGTAGYTFTFNGESVGSQNTYIISASGDYTVTVTDSSGCIATATRYFEFIDICIPNYFTPNGDNVLDTWAPGCAIHYPNMEFKIFDRYGREVGAYRQGQAWDGRYKERELPTGDYWYIIKLNGAKDDREFVGHFTLYR